MFVVECVWGDGREPRACRSAFDGKFCRRDECQAPHWHRSFANGTRRLVPRKKQAFSLHRPLLQVKLPQAKPKSGGVPSLYSVRFRAHSGECARDRNRCRTVLAFHFFLRDAQSAMCIPLRWVGGPR